MNPVTFDDQLNQQIAQAEARERDARAAELRLQAMGLPPGSIKPRNYAAMPRVEGLSARAMVARKDPGLALLLGLPVPRPGYEAEAAAAERAAAIQRMQQATEATRQRNQQAADDRYRRQLQGVDAWGRPRWAR